MHLATHARYRRDIFVTRNHWDFIHRRRSPKRRAVQPEDLNYAKARELRERFGLLVMSPADAVAEVRRRLAVPG